MVTVGTHHGFAKAPAMRSRAQYYNCNPIGDTVRPIMRAPQCEAQPQQ